MKPEEILDEIIGQPFRPLFGDNDTDWVILAMEKYAKQEAQESLTSKRVLDFGSYILSQLRVQDIATHPLYAGATPYELKQRLSQVRDTDLVAFKNHEKELKN